MQTAAVQPLGTEPAWQLPLRCRIVHTIPGRLRLRVEPTLLFTSLAPAFATSLRNLRGIREVSLNPSCRSLTLVYDPNLWEPQTLLAHVQAISPDQLTTPSASLSSQVESSGTLPWLPFGLASAAAAFGVLGESAFTPWLLLGAAVPIFTHAYEALTQKNVLNGDVLDAAATAVLSLDGQTPTAAILVWFRALGDFLHALTRQQAQRAIVSLAEGSPLFGETGQLPCDSLMQETQLQRDAEQFADRVTPWNLAGAGTALLSGNESLAAALLIADYETGIRIAAPTVTLSSLTKSTTEGILIKKGNTLERLASVNVLVFDKTGVLTLGTPEIIEIIPYGKKISPERVLALATAAERQVNHPLADAVIRAAESKGIEVPNREAVEYRSGLGVEAVVEGAVVLVGSQRFMMQKRVPLQRARKDLRALGSRTASPLFVAVDGKLIGLLVVTDPLRPEAPEVIASLREQSVKEIIMLTGDHPTTAETIAKQLGISRYLADAFPEQKREFIRSLQQQEQMVAVVASGRLPSLSFAQADVVITIGDGANIAQEAPQIILHNGNLFQVLRALNLAQEEIIRNRQNWDLLFYANTTALALSLLGVIGPLGAILLSNGSAVAATLNALRPHRGVS